MRRPLVLGTIVALGGLLSGEALARPPLFEINPIHAQTVEAGRRLRFQVTYTVTDEVCWGDNISFQLASGPAGMTVSPGGLVDWTPALAQAGRTYSATVQAQARARQGSPCYGNLAQDFESFSVDVTAPPPPDPPTAAINFELTETAINNSLASLTEVRGLNFGKYIAGFVDAWWANLDRASIDVLPPSGPANRVRISASATFEAVLDLFVFTLPLKAGAGGWIEGDVRLAGDPETGYTLFVKPTNLDVDGWINGAPDFLVDIVLNMVADDLLAMPEIELNLGTRLAPQFACARPSLTTNAKHTALVLEWDVSDLDCTQVTLAAQ
jgi:hypothetical protein